MASSNQPFRSRPPKKLTKKLKRHLSKVKRQNQAEYERQVDMVRNG